MDHRRRTVCLALGGLVAARAAAQPNVHRLGYLSTRASHGALDDAFLAGMREHGYEVGRNLAIDYRWAGNDASRLPALAAELVALRVDVVVTATTAGTRAAMQATRTIPIVMAAAADPVGAGLVASLGRPGGNVTGMSLQTTDMAAKRLQLAREVAGSATRIALLAEKVATPAQGTTAALVAETTAAAQAAGASLLVREVASVDAIDGAFADFRRAGAQVAIVQVSPLFLQHAARVVDAAARERLPAIYEARNFVEAGGLLSLGPDLRETYRRAAGYVDRILRGTKPADLPVGQPDRLEMVINARAAEALGLALPAAVQMRASEVLR